MRQAFQTIFNIRSVFTVLVFASLAACKKDATVDNRIETQLNNLNQQATAELRQAMNATDKYQDIQIAYADGYADINVVMQNMGYHYMKSELTDSVFDYTKPEILVYNKKADSSFQLVAIEYAVPLDKSVNAPEGFTGDDDVWTHSDDFGLWLLHAWVYTYNPDGIFTSMNPDVIVP